MSNIYWKLDDSGFVIRIPANKVKLLKWNNNGIFTRLAYDNNYYEFDNDGKEDLPRVVNKNGETIFKTYLILIKKKNMLFVENNYANW